MNVVQQHARVNCILYSVFVLSYIMWKHMVATHSNSYFRCGTYRIRKISFNLKCYSVFVLYRLLNYNIPLEILFWENSEKSKSFNIRTDTMSAEKKERTDVEGNSSIDSFSDEDSDGHVPKHTRPNKIIKGEPWGQGGGLVRSKAHCSKGAPVHWGGGEKALPKPLC
jgi:hypothetical protein